MTDGLLLLVLIDGLVVVVLLFSRKERETLEYLVFGAGVLIILATLVIWWVEQRSEPPQTALGIEQEPGAAAPLLPGTETQAPVSPTSTPQRPAASATASTPVAAKTVAATPDVPTPRPTEDEAPTSSPEGSTASPEAPPASSEAPVTTVRVESANIRREPTRTSPIVGNVARNDELVVLNVQNGWVLVQLGERHAPSSVLRGGQGWISGELINLPER